MRCLREIPLRRTHNGPEPASKNPDISQTSSHEPVPKEDKWGGKEIPDYDLEKKEYFLTR